MKKTVIRQQDKVLLIGDSEEILLEYRAYERFKFWLGDDSKIFAQVLDFQPMGRQACLTLELVEGRTLEQLLETGCEDEAMETVRKTLAILAQWQAQPLAGDQAVLIKELKESIDSRLVRLKALGQTGDTEELWEVVKNNFVFSDFPLHVCHRDLQTRNIILQSNGQIRLIDPRFALHGSLVDTPGHAIIDLVQLHAALDRPWDNSVKSSDFRKELATMVWQKTAAFSSKDPKPKLYHLVAAQRYLNICYHMVRADRHQTTEVMRQAARKHIRKLITGCWIKA